MITIQEQQELLKSEEFENALLEGAECKKTILTTYKEQNKTNYERFYEVMLEVNDEIKSIIDKKKKYRSEEDEKKLKEFKKNVSSMYKQAQELCVKEKLEDGQKTKIQKIVDKIVPVIDVLRYIGANELENEFSKRGITLATGLRLEDKYQKLNNDEKRAVIKDIFNNAKNIKQKMVDDNDKIGTDIFQSKVPIDLQYDKGSNNIGIKQNDFMKLVDMKTKLLMATTDEAKEKVNDSIEELAGEKQFEAARANLVRDSLTNMQ